MSGTYILLDTQVHVILDWLGATDQSPRFQTALETRHNNTGSWLLAGDPYRLWRSTTGSFWVHGIRKFIRPRCSDSELTRRRSWVWKDYPLVMRIDQKF